ncbi:MAG TPA: HhH-GPD-type base excision DNA repair protein [Candidatus Acidoferrales bacterium]|nr:HhH-GPD-type base excision DNA repair protein [Candidatus Acidoferrales bacterium]
MPIVWTRNEAANRLLEEDPLALLVGLVLDQQVPMERAFSGPYELKQRLGGVLDAHRIAKMDPEELDRVFRQRPALHRFPGSMARRVQAVCQVVVGEYGGDAARVWKDARDGDELAARIGRLPGFGEMKVKILVSVLAKKFGVRPAGWEKHAAHWHTVADVDSEASMQQARDVKRQMKAEHKGA